MIEISEEMKHSLRELNESLRAIRKTHPNKTTLRDFISRELGNLSLINPLTQGELREIEREGGLVAVDGSLNRQGGLKPHYLDIFQGVAKSTIGGRSISLSDFYSPLLDDEYSEDSDSVRDKLLAEIEINTAISAIEILKPKVIMMDGSLLRYRIYNEALWEELKEKAIEHNIILMGVIKDIKTSFIGERLGIKAYDRELLYGNFEVGEFFLINSEINKSKKSGFSSGFLRASNDPNVCGIDIIEEEEESLIMSARLALSLTPKDSRGVPLFLDIVDKEAKISDKMLKASLENYIDRDLYELFIVSERQKRN